MCTKIKYMDVQKYILYEIWYTTGNQVFKFNNTNVDSGITNQLTSTSFFKL